MWDPGHFLSRASRQRGWLSPGQREAGAPLGERTGGRGAGQGLGARRPAGGAAGRLLRRGRGRPWRRGGGAVASRPRGHGPVGAAPRGTAGVRIVRCPDGVSRARRWVSDGGVRAPCSAPKPAGTHRIASGLLRKKRLTPNPTELRM